MKTVSPVPPPERSQTQRQAIIQVLSATPLSALEISGVAGVAEKAVYEHLVHIIRSRKYGVRVVPAKCRECGYIFAKRDRLTKPGRCPKCRCGRITTPRFYVKS